MSYFHNYNCRGCKSPMADLRSRMLDLEIRVADLKSRMADLKAAWRI